MAASEKTGIAPQIREEFGSTEDRLGALEAKVAENQAASTAATVAQVKDDINALLEKLKDAGLMEADAED